jgi:hypothetical protein
MSRPALAGLAGLNTLRAEDQHGVANAAIEAAPRVKATVLEAIGREFLKPLQRSDDRHALSALPKEKTLERVAKESEASNRHDQ